MEGHRDYLNLSFVILFQKYPDTVSTYPSLCGMNKINGDAISLNIDNLLRLTGMSEEVFIDKVKNYNKIPLQRLLGTYWYDRIRDLRHNEGRLLREIGFIEKCNTSEAKRKLETLSEMTISERYESLNIVQTLEGTYNDDASVNIDTDYDNFCEKKSIVSFYKEINYQINGFVLNKDEYLLRHLASFTEENRISHNFTLYGNTSPVLNNDLIFLNEDHILPYDIMFNQDFQDYKKSNIVKKGSRVNKNSIFTRNLFWILPLINTDANKNPIDIIFYTDGTLGKEIKLVYDFVLPKQARRLDGTIIPAGTLIGTGTIIPMGTMFEAGTIFPANSVYLNADSKKYYEKYLKYKIKYLKLKKQLDNF